MINTLSNYFIYIPWINPITTNVAVSYTLDLFIWNGLKAAVPLTPIYQMTKPNPTLSNGNDRIDIARIINDFIDFDYAPITGNVLQDGNNQIWFRYQVRYSDNPLVDQLITTNFAVKGYGFWNQGENPQLPANRILIESDEYKVSRNSKFVVPILLDESLSLGNVTVKSFPSLLINATLSTATTTNSNKLITNINVDVSLANPVDEYIEVAFNGVTKTLLITDECRYSPIDIAFQNKNGSVEIITFFKVKKESVSFTNEEFQSDNINRQFVKYNINSKTKFSVNSGFVDESRNSSFYQLIASERVWQLQGATAVPINVATKSFQYKTRNNDRLINYEIEFEYAFNDIN